MRCSSTACYTPNIVLTERTCVYSREIQKAAAYWMILLLSMIGVNLLLGRWDGRETVGPFISSERFSILYKGTQLTKRTEVQSPLLWYTTKHRNSTGGSDVLCNYSELQRHLNLFEVYHYGVILFSKYQIGMTTLVHRGPVVSYCLLSQFVSAINL